MNCCNSQHKTLRIVLLYLSSLISAMWSSTRALKALSVGVWAVQVVVQVDFHKKYCNGVSRCSWTNLLPTGLPVVLWLFCFIHSSSHQQIIPIWNSSLFAFVAQQLVAVTTLPILLYCFLSIMIETCIWSSILLSELPIIKVHFSE